ncbi:GNAT family N-acetyltransferase [Plantactinospora veratri]
MQRRPDPADRAVPGRLVRRRTGRLCRRTAGRPAVRRGDPVFVRPGARRSGGGARLLAAVEEAAAAHGATTMRLDTRHDLVEARALYAGHGYREVPAYSTSPYADHWFEKRLD